MSSCSCISLRSLRERTDCSLSPPFVYPHQPGTNRNGWHTPFTQANFFSGSHEFIGFDGKTTYKWKRASMSSDWTVRLSTSLLYWTRGPKLNLSPRFARLDPHSSSRNSLTTNDR